MDSAIRSLACVLIASLALAQECLALGGKQGNTVTKSHTDGRLCPHHSLLAFYTHIYIYATLFVYHHRVNKFTIPFMFLLLIY